MSEREAGPAPPGGAVATWPTVYTRRSAAVWPPPGVFGDVVGTGCGGEGSDGGRATAPGPGERHIHAGDGYGGGRTRYVVPSGRRPRRPGGEGPRPDPRDPGFQRE